jgi:hypothetical protein
MSAYDPKQTSRLITTQVSPAGRKLLPNPYLRGVLSGHATARVHHASRRHGDGVFGSVAGRIRAAAIDEGLSNRVPGFAHG